MNAEHAGLEHFMTTDGCLRCMPLTFFVFHVCFSHQVLDVTLVCGPEGYNYHVAMFFRALSVNHRMLAIMCCS